MDVVREGGKNEAHLRVEELDLDVRIRSTSDIHLLQLPRLQNGNWNGKVQHKCQAIVERHFPDGSKLSSAAMLEFMRLGILKKCTTPQF